MGKKLANIVRSISILYGRQNEGKKKSFDSQILTLFLCMKIICRISGPRAFYAWEFEIKVETINLYNFHRF